MLGRGCLTAEAYMCVAPRKAQWGGPRGGEHQAILARSHLPPPPTSPKHKGAVRKQSSQPSSPPAGQQLEPGRQVLCAHRLAGQCCIVAQALPLPSRPVAGESGLVVLVCSIRWHSLAEPPLDQLGLTWNASRSRRRHEPLHPHANSSPISSAGQSLQHNGPQSPPTIPIPPAHPRPS